MANAPLCQTQSCALAGTLATASLDYVRVRVSEVCAEASRPACLQCLTMLLRLVTVYRGNCWQSSEGCITLLAHKVGVWLVCVRVCVWWRISTTGAETLGSGVLLLHVAHPCPLIAASCRNLHDLYAASLPRNACNDACMHTCWWCLSKHTVLSFANTFEMSAQATLACTAFQWSCDASRAAGISVGWLAGPQNLRAGYHLSLQASNTLWPFIP